MNAILSPEPQATPATEPLADPLAAPLVARLVAQHGAQFVDRDSHRAFAAGAGDRVLFFTGDAVRFPESLDVAVVLPELMAALRRPDGRAPFAVGVVCRRDEDEVARAWASQRWPSLVFLRDGGYVGVLAGMHDWTDYVTRVRELLAAPTTRVPGIGIPVVAAQAPGCH